MNSEVSSPVGFTINPVTVMKRAAYILLVFRPASVDGFVFPHRTSQRHASAGVRESSPKNYVNGAIAQVKETDTLEQFEADITTVLRDLRPHAQDPTIPLYFGGKRLSFTNYWNLDDWNRHNSRWRFVRYIRGFPKSSLLRRVIPQMSALVAWSWLSVSLHYRSASFYRMNLPLSSLSLLSTFVAALQTLRSNQGLSRLERGREAMGQSVLLTRDTAMLFAAYIYPKDKALGLKAARALSQFGWSLKSHLRETHGGDVLRVLLPRSHRYVSRQRKKPIALLALLRQIMYEMCQRQVITTTEHRLIEDNIRGLDGVVMTAEKIRATPIPPLYSALSARLMIIYLFGLPLALLGLDLNGATTILLTSIVGFAILGLDEISHVFEQPFEFMPLYQLAKVSMLDVADSFVCQPPPLSNDEEDDSEGSGVPTYWQYVRDSLPYGTSDEGRSQLKAII